MNKIIALVISVCLLLHGCDIKGIEPSQIRYEISQYQSTRNLKPSEILLYTTSKDKGEYIKLRFYPNGALHSINSISNNELTGPSLTLSSKGYILNKGYLVNGKMDGIWEDYNDGKLNSIINYDSGEKEGEAKIFDEKGNVKRIEYYENGKLINTESINTL